MTIERTMEEATHLIDEIVGRCVADPVYAEFVLDHPEEALAPLHPDEDILDDFRALAPMRAEALDQWARMRVLFYGAN